MSHEFKWMANSMKMSDQTGVATITACGKTYHINLECFEDANSIDRMLTDVFKSGKICGELGIRSRINDALEKTA